MILYVDVFILINAFCDSLALYGCAKVMSLKINGFRMAISVTLMTLYAFLTLIFPVHYIIGTLLNGVVMCAGCLVCYGFCDTGHFIRLCCMFITCCIIIGGGFSLIVGLSPAGKIVAVISTPAICFCSRMILKKKRVPLEVTVDGEVFYGIEDSGNMLCDPQSGLSVIVLSNEKVSPPGNGRFIKINTAAGSDLVLIYEPQNIKIGKNKVRAMIAISNQKLNGCDCLVPTDLL